MSDDIFGDLFLIADRLRTVANNGLMHQKNPYDRERLFEVLSASAQMRSVMENRPAATVMSEYEEDMNHVCPLIGAEAAVFRDGKLLLIKRHDDKLWAVPGGKTDVGETLQESALRELKEETGLTGQIVRLLGIFDSRKWKTRTKFHMYHAIFETVIGDQTPITTDEALDCRFYAETELPELSHGHDARVPFLFKLYHGEVKTPFLD